MKNQAKIHYYDIGDYLDRDEKLAVLREFGDIGSVPWEIVTPNSKHDWINQRDNTFDAFVALGDKKDDQAETVFENYSRGLETTRDSWCYNFSRKKLSDNTKRMIDCYNEQVKGYKEKCKYFPETKVDDFVDNDPTKISWSSSLKSFFERQMEIPFSIKNITTALYRPFFKQIAYFDGYMNHRVGQWPKIFPEPGMENLVISICGVGVTKDFSSLISSTLPDIQMLANGQCFPLYTYERAEEQSRVRKNSLLDSQSYDCGSGVRIGDYIRRENISDAMLQKFQQHDSPLATRNSPLTKEDIFYYVYAILHSKSYRERFAADLKKQLPRIPLVGVSGEWRVAGKVASSEWRVASEEGTPHATHHSSLFWTFSKAGRQLAELHLNYEDGEMYPLKEVVSGESRVVSYRVEKMKLARHSPLATHHSKIIYNANLTLEGIPPETYQYVVNGKSALDWIMERYAVTTHKDSGITNDPNDWCREHNNDRYIVDLIKRVVHLSVESVKIIDRLPELGF